MTVPAAAAMPHSMLFRVAGPTRRDAQSRVCNRLAA
jgi:hypothetical protein